MKRKNLYCYNPVKKDFICNMGIRYIYEGVHFKTNRKFWVFTRDDKLDIILKRWRELQKIKFEIIK